MTPVTLFNVDLPEGFKDNVLALPGQVDSVIKSNRGGWQSQLYKKGSFSWMDPIYDQVIAIANKPTATYWFNINDKDNYNEWHDHERGTKGELCGCLYVLTPDDCGNFAYRYKKEEYQITPTAGMFILFPDNLQHTVYPNSTNNVRISIAFNFWKM